MYGVAAGVALVNVLVLAVFVCVAVSHADIHRETPMFSADPTVLLKAFPFAMWPYIGIEITPMLSEEIAYAPTNVPRGMLISFGVLFVSTLPLIVLLPMLPSFDGLNGVQ